MAKATTAILLAAGEGKRMVSKKQKVMHNLCGRPMLGWVSAAFSSISRRDP